MTHPRFLRLQRLPATTRPQNVNRNLQIDLAILRAGHPPCAITIRPPNLLVSPEIRRRKISVGRREVGVIGRLERGDAQGHAAFPPRARREHAAWASRRRICLNRMVLNRMIWLDDTKQNVPARTPDAPLSGDNGVEMRRVPILILLAAAGAPAQSRVKTEDGVIMGVASGIADRGCAIPSRVDSCRRKAITV